MNEQRQNEAMPPATEADTAVEQRIWKALERVHDPELQQNIVELGLVYGVSVRDGAAAVRMTFTSPGCPYGPYLVHLVRAGVKAVPGVKSETFELVWEPPWGPSKMSEEVRLRLGFDL